jgi:hypothetical protein
MVLKGMVGIALELAGSSLAPRIADWVVHNGLAASRNCLRSVNRVSSRVATIIHARAGKPTVARQ